MSTDSLPGIDFKAPWADPAEVFGVDSSIKRANEEIAAEENFPPVFSSFSETAFTPKTPSMLFDSPLPEKAADGFLKKEPDALARVTERISDSDGFHFSLSPREKTEDISDYFDTKKLAVSLSYTRKF